MHLTKLHTLIYYTNDRTLKNIKFTHYLFFIKFRKKFKFKLLLYT